ncbi:MAG: ABC transporter substrate-binding protein [Deltaproteobacteria bacterium]
MKSWQISRNDDYTTSWFAVLNRHDKLQPDPLISQVKTPCTSVLVVSKDSPIKTWKDLKGKHIAGISPTCEAVIAYEKKARENGGEYILEKLSGGPAIAALEAGKVDGAILDEPPVSIAELKSPLSF